MNVQRFLRVGGLAMIVLGVVGLVPGLVGPTPDRSIFGATWYLDSAQGWSFLITGILALASAYLLKPAVQRWATLALGIVLIAVGTYTFFLPEFFTLHLENPADAVVYLVLGGWAVIAGFVPGAAAAADH